MDIEFVDKDGRNIPMAGNLGLGQFQALVEIASWWTAHWPTTAASAKRASATHDTAIAATVVPPTQRFL